MKDHVAAAARFDERGEVENISVRYRDAAFSKPDNRIPPWRRRLANDGGLTNERTNMPSFVGKTLDNVRADESRRSCDERRRHQALGRKRQVSDIDTRFTTFPARGQRRANLDLAPDHADRNAAEPG